MIAPAHPPIATEYLNYVGEPYAIVIGETLQAARDAVELLEVDFEELPAVVNLAAAAGEDQIHSNVPNNQATIGSGGQRRNGRSLPSADHVTSINIVNNRLIPNAMEPRAAVGKYEQATGSYTLFTTSQNPHLERFGF
ncbi:MAG: hypothetical protein CM1200mP24_04670 [Gammaproteobacteria bacterium]|nr:MAG: hypothetical protein CM1200mP24_04670 [Gammaproteobacteria bacterium]